MSLRLHSSSFPFAGDFSSFDSPLILSLFDELNARNQNHNSTQRAPTARPFNPRFDVRESEEAYLLDGDLPGIAQKDIDIEFSDHQTLVVKGRTEREYHRTKPDVTDVSDNQEVTTTESSDTEANKKPTHRYWASERTVGEFQRTFSFPSRVDQDGVKASLKNGVLSIVIPKATAAASKKITIE